MSKDWLVSITLPRGNDKAAEELFLAEGRMQFDAVRKMSFSVVDDMTYRCWHIVPEFWDDNTIDWIQEIIPPGLEWSFRLDIPEIPPDEDF